MTKATGNRLFFRVGEPEGFSNIYNNFVVCRSLSIAFLVFFMAAAAAQEPAPPVKESSEARETELKPPEQTVQIEAEAHDSEIARRLLEILQATERFQDPEVHVRDGVVFLRGVVGAEDHKAWARDLAGKTEGVVAVVNNIRVDEGPIWNFDPAQHELTQLAREAVRGLPLVLIGIAAMLVTACASKGISRGVVRLLAHRIDSRIFRGVVEKVVVLLVLLLGVYIFLRISGLTWIAATVVGGTGLAGLIVGLAFATSRRISWPAF